MGFLFLLSLLLLINHHWKAPFIEETCLTMSIKLEIARKYWKKFPLEKNPLCPELATSVLPRAGRHHRPLNHHSPQLQNTLQISQATPALTLTCWLTKDFKQKNMTTDTDSGSSLRQHVSNGYENGGSAQG